MIQQLESDVISELRSGVALTSISQCVEELVLNSVDAGSTSITIDVDICSMSVEVSDNGTGIGEDDLRAMGNRYFTSKCKNLQDLENASSYGYRGEAVASLGKICGKVEIISRQKASYRTFCKLVKSGKDMGVYERPKPRSRHGTTIFAYGIFYALPVRRKLLSTTLALEHIRRRIIAIAIIHPELSFVLRNKENGCVYLETHRSQSVLSIISQVFGCAQSKGFKPLNHTIDSYKITGYMNLMQQQNKNLQFFFINKRLVLKTKFHKIANSILGRRNAKPDDVLQQKICSPKTQEKYAGFILNLECPHNSYDITFDPAKTLVEFEDWHKPVMCLTQCLNYFLVKEGFSSTELIDGMMTNNYLDNDIKNKELLISTEAQMEASSDTRLVSQSNLVPKKTISPSNVRWSLHSLTAKRKTVSLCCEKGRKSPRKCIDALDQCQSTNSVYSCNSSSSESIKSVSDKLKEDNLVKCTNNTNVTMAPSCSQDFDTNVSSLQESVSPSWNKKSSIDTIRQIRCGKGSHWTHGKSSRELSRCKSIRLRLCQELNSGCGKAKEKRKLESEKKMTFHPNMKLKDPKSRKDESILKENINISLTPQNRLTSELETVEVSRVDDFNLTPFTRSNVFENKGGNKNGNGVAHFGEFGGLMCTSVYGDSGVRNGYVVGIAESSDGGSAEGNVDGDNGVRYGYVVASAGSSGGGSAGNSGCGSAGCRVGDANGCHGDANGCHGDDGHCGMGGSNGHVGDGIGDFGSSSVGVCGGDGLGMIIGVDGHCYGGGGDASDSCGSHGVGVAGDNCDDGVCNNVSAVSGGSVVGSSSSFSAGTVGTANCINNQDSEWLSHYDPSYGQQVYVNLRTGNTRLTKPPTDQHPEKIKPDRKRPITQTRKLHPFAAHLSHNFTPWLPRNASPKNEGRSSSGNDESRRLDTMWKNWVNPVFETNGKAIIDASLHNSSKTLVKVHGTPLPFHFTKGCFKDMDVIKQLDKKFIVCRLYKGNDKDNLLVIVDQHAAHERVRLEKFTKDMYTSPSGATKPACIQSSSLTTPCKLVFSEREVHSMKVFRVELERVGIKFDEEEPLYKKQQQQSVIIRTAPSLFLGREQSGVGTWSSDGLEKNIEQLIKEQIEVLLSTNGTSTALPRTLVRTLNSQACHGAIRFGDALSLNDCKCLMKSLSKCDLPFQCAHGRPSMVPLISLKSTAQEISKKGIKSPQLWKLKKRMEDESTVNKCN